MYRRLVRYLYESGWVYHLRDAVRTVNLLAFSHYPVGTNVLDRDWDLLVVLDACRKDALEAVADEYEFVTDVDGIWSVGSATREWVANTFTEEYREAVGDIAWVSANGTEQWVFERESPQLYDLPLSRFHGWNVVSAEDFSMIDPLWQYQSGNPWSDLTLPETVTDRAIAVGREHDPDRMIVMYKQPHAPYTANAVAEDRPPEPHEEDPWTALREGVPRERVWSAYLDEVRWGLDNVATLLDNYDADRVVITADHGEAFGEFGIYSHPVGVPLPVLRRVPWVTMSATDSGEYAPEADPTGPGDGERAIEDQLEKLGYL